MNYRAYTHDIVHPHTSHVCTTVLKHELTLTEAQLSQD